MTDASCLVDSRRADEIQKMEPTIEAVLQDAVSQMLSDVAAPMVADQVRLTMERYSFHLQDGDALCGILGGCSGTVDNVIVRSNVFLGWYVALVAVAICAWLVAFGLFFCYDPHIASDTNPVFKGRESSEPISAASEISAAGREPSSRHGSQRLSRGDKPDPSSFTRPTIASMDKPNACVHTHL